MLSLAPAFDDVRTSIMGEAFDTICARLHGVDYSSRVREVIASRIIEIEHATLEQDPRRLADTVVASLGIKL